MPLTDSQKHDLFLRAYGQLIARPTWPASTPPARDGTTKPVSHAFAVACWARAFQRAAVAVLEEPERQAGGKAGHGDGGESQPY